ncbi:MAG: transcriptional regulator GlxA family with amidase domain [Flavobacteriaceae bacterium]|jgi:transcriptional regulator GlxA family with amidase domain
MMTRLIFPMLLCALVACSNNQDSPSGSSQVNPRDSLATVQLDENAYNVALLVMDGTFNTELTAPMDIFQHTKYRENIKPMNVFTIANTLDPIKTFEGLTILPDFDYTADYPEIDILVIPAAEHNLDSDLHDEALLTFIKSVNENALYVTSHCDGAFVLAKTGLLDDRVSTTFPGDVDAYKVMYPTLDVREDVVFVHDGKYITSAGGAKSFEASLYLCELLYGKKVADELAEGMVIDWNLARLKYIVIL